MTLCIQPANMVWRTFSNQDDLPPHSSQEVMADYLRAFFLSHGETQEPDNEWLDRWLNSGQLSFVHMMQALLPELQARHLLQDIDLALFAHWTPDTDIGCAVPNALINACGARQAFGLSISDRGLAAPLFALYAIDEYLTGDPSRQKALLMIADQDLAPYPSERLRLLQPRKNCSLLLIEKHAPAQAYGLVYEGYYRQPYASDGDLTLTVRQLLARVREQHADPLPITLLVGATLFVALQNGVGDAQLAQVAESLLCAAPFVYLKTAAQPDNRYLMVVAEARHLTACAFRCQPDRNPFPHSPVLTR
ncbi:hypothetical protein [Musicola keenii]|uniref:hypothetical protein n=1 Tax=Musicola keenii TaxID=2884250 RepID=UPI001CE312A3|nr:hypothetical protein [Musicola keenii]